MLTPDADSLTCPSHGRLRKLFDEARQRARGRRRRLIALVLVAATAIIGVAAVARQNKGRPGATGMSSVSHLPNSLRVAPSVTGKHDRVIVSITARHTTGVFGTVKRSYYMQAQRVRPGTGCVNNRSGSFPDASAGHRIHATLNPAQGDGGPEGWCPGVYRGMVSYIQGFDCASVQGPCHAPPGIPHGSAVVARFSYRVR